MSDEFDSTELPDELREVASRLRSLRPAGSQASEAECMYRAGWQAALAASASPARSSAPSWNKSYFGGLVSGTISGALVAGALAAILIFGMAKSWKSAEGLPDAGSVARETVEPASGSPLSEDLDNQLVSAQPSAQTPRQRRDSVEGTATLIPAFTDDLRATALLSPVARHQWREALTQAAAPYALPLSDSTPSRASPAEPLRSSPRNLNGTWF